MKKVVSNNSENVITVSNETREWMQLCKEFKAMQNRFNEFYDAHIGKDDPEMAKEIEREMSQHFAAINNELEKELSVGLTADALSH